MNGNLAVLAYATGGFLIVVYAWGRPDVPLRKLGLVLLVFLALGGPFFARATSLLRALDSAVDTLRGQHMVSDVRAAEIHGASADTRNALRRYVPRSTTSTTAPRATTTAPSPVPSPNWKHEPKHGGDQHQGGGGD